MNSLRNLILFALILPGCSAVRHTTEFQKDSVFVSVHDEVIVRDTVVMIAPPDETDKAVIRDTDTSRLQTSLAESEAFVKNGQLYHTLRNRTERLWPVKVQYYDRVKTQTSATLAQSRQIVEVPRELTRWQRFLMSVGWTVIVAGALWVVRKALKLFL